MDRGKSGSTALPVLIGLCPGEHTAEFYVPIAPGESLVCPECDEKMQLYVAAEDSDRRVRRAYAAGREDAP